MEDGLLIAEVESNMAADLWSKDGGRMSGALEWAGQRVQQHWSLEHQRARAGLKTDLERYMDGERITD